MEGVAEQKVSVRAFGLVGSFINQIIYLMTLSKGYL